jgi:hypothetical protein
MRHPRADVAVTAAPTVIAPGMAVLPPLPRMLFRADSISEQVLVVTIRGFGLVLIGGCGHPPIERILGMTPRVLDVPIHAVVGGLHLPVPAAGTALIPQAVLGDPHPPWQPITERDADRVLDEIQARGPRPSVHRRRRGRGDGGFASEVCTPGRVIVNWAQVPGPPLAAVRVLPWAAMRARAMVSPIPDPPWARSRAVSAR